MRTWLQIDGLAVLWIHHFVLSPFFKPTKLEFACNAYKLYAAIFWDDFGYNAIFSCLTNGECSKVEAVRTVEICVPVSAAQHV